MTANGMDLLLQAAESVFNRPPHTDTDQDDEKVRALIHLDEFERQKTKGNGRLPLQCKICEKAFTAASSVRTHYKSHAGLKEFQCQVCLATFTRASSLKFHKMMHTGETRFKCDVCSHEFRSSGHYKEHLRKHTGEQPYQCKDCSSKYRLRSTFKRHLLKQHGKMLSADGSITQSPYR